MTTLIKQAQKQERIEQLTAFIEIERNATGLYAIVPSLTSSKKYFIDINEVTFAVGPCQCAGAKSGYVCQHSIAVGVIVEASRRAVLDRVCTTYACPVATVCSIEQAIEEAEAMLLETPDEVAATSSAQDVLERRTRFFQWKQEQEADAMAYEYCAIASQQQQASDTSGAYCDYCGKIFRPRNEWHTTCNRCC